LTAKDGGKRRWAISKRQASDFLKGKVSALPKISFGAQ
jgi:hypothetical protein